MRANKNKGFKYPVVHNITREGLGFWYSNKKKKKWSQSSFKLPTSFNILTMIVKVNGMSQLTFGIKNKKHGDLIVSLDKYLDLKK